MKKHAYMILLLAGAYVNATAQSDVATAKWMQQPVKVDGKLAEWQQPLNFYDSDTKLLFDIANDSNNIYLCFESKEEIDQMKLMRAGMKITLSTKGKSKHEASVMYPLSQSNSPQSAANKAVDTANEPMSEAQRVHDLSSFRAHFLQQHTTMKVQGFATVNGDIPVTDTSGITAAINWDNESNLVYEIAIPKKEFWGADFAAKEALGDITLSVEINGLPRSSSPGGETRSGGYHEGGGMHGMHGEGMKGGGQYGGEHGSGRQWTEEDRASLNRKTSFKQKFVVSSPGT